MAVCVRRKTFYCGDKHVEVEAFLTSPDVRPHGPRRRTGEPTPTKQIYSNLKNSLKKLRRLIKSNYTTGLDWYIVLTYNDKFLPQDDMEAVGELRKFKSRLMDMCKRKGIECRIIGVTERGWENNRLHHHVFINCDVPLDLIMKAWRKKLNDDSPKEPMGSIYNETVPTDVDNLECISSYTLKCPIGKHKWIQTRNLIQPEIDIDDKAIPYGEFVQLGYSGFDRNEMFLLLTDMYPEYTPVDYMGKIIDTRNGALYMSASLERKPQWEDVDADVRTWCKRYDCYVKPGYVNHRKKMIALTAVDRWIDKKSCRLPSLTSVLTLGWRDYMARYLESFIQDGMTSYDASKVFDAKILSDNTFGRMLLSYVGSRI